MREAINTGVGKCVFIDENQLQILSELEKARSLIQEADEYLTREDGVANYIGSTSILHRKFRAFLKAHRGEGEKPVFQVPGCPNCRSRNFARERSPNGNTECLDCRFKTTSKEWDAFTLQKPDPKGT